jgi:hypothetical protein
MRHYQRVPIKNQNRRHVLQELILIGPLQHHRSHATQRVDHSLGLLDPR